MHRYDPPIGPALRRGRFWSLALLLWSTIAGANVSEPLELATAAIAPQSLYGRFDILVDHNHAYTIEELVAGRGAAGFVASTERNANIGFTTAQVWAKFAIRYGADVREAVVLVLPKPLLDEVAFYRVDGDGAIERIVTGDAYPFDSRPFSYHAYAFELDPDPGRTVTYYLRVHSPTSAVGLPLSLFGAADFRASATAENVLMGGYFGVMAALALCALVLFALIRNPTFAYYFFYLIALALLIGAVNGYGMQFLWPRSPVGQQMLPTVLLALSITSGILFVRRLLNLPRIMPGSDKVLLTAVAAAAAGVVLHLVWPTPVGTTLVIATAIVLCPVVLVLCLSAIAAGDHVARYFLVGWIAYVIGITATALDMTGFIAQSSLSTYGMYCGSLVEFIALAIALGDRLWALQRDRETQIAAVNGDLAELNANLEQIVHNRTRELEEHNRELSELAVRDSLTGLYNHSTSIELLDQILHQSQRYEFPVAVIMVDLDNFKQLNDAHGHQVGDKVLEAVSQTLTDSVRGADVVGRYGGEEFLIVMPHADSPAAREYGDRLLHRIRGISVTPAGGAGAISASIGISVFHPRGHRASAQEVIHRADEALYRSKRDGRDRMTVDSLSLVAAKDGERRLKEPPTPA